MLRKRGWRFGGGAGSVEVCARGVTGLFRLGVEGSRKFAAVTDRRYMERILIMNELDSLEQEMREWQPRKPAERLARRLFGRADRAPATLRRAEFWSWLSPLAVCALTVLVAVGSANYRGATPEGKDGPDLFDGLSLYPGASNAPRMARLSQLDENVQWNVCPEMASPPGTSFGESSAPVGEGRAAATNLNLN